MRNKINVTMTDNQTRVLKTSFLECEDVEDIDRDMLEVMFNEISHELKKDRIKLSELKSINFTRE